MWVVRFFRPHYRIEVKRNMSAGRTGFGYYIWKGWTLPEIMYSKYGFTTAVEAAEDGVKVKKDLLEAWKLTR